MAGRRQTATMELAIGAAIIAAIITLIVMLMAWGNSSSFLSRHYRVVVNMTNVGGLKEGAPVKLGGFQIGRVASIQIRPGSMELEIILDIDENRLLPKDSTAKVSTAGLVGDAFMEIIPGKSSETLKRASNIAEAERIQSSPLPDLSEVLAQVNVFGGELITLTGHLNDIVGDATFRKNIKSIAVNLDAVSYEANLLLQRGQHLVDNAETAVQNIVVLSASLRETLDKVSKNVVEVTDTARDIASTAKHTMVNLDDGIADARNVIANINAGIDDARKAINSTVGDPKVAENLSKAVANINAITENLAAKRQDIDTILENVSKLSGDLKDVGGKARTIADSIDPAKLAATVNNMSGAITSMTDMVEKIKAEPVLALSVNKAADRIVKMKFDEMSKQPQYKTADAVLEEINRWVRESMERGYFQDPAYSHENRPYVMDR